MPSVVSVRLYPLVLAFACTTTACDEPSTLDPTPLEWPRTAQCEDLEMWPVASSELEEATVDLIDELRTEGADCGEGGKFGPAAALVRHPALDCAARFHALDMVEQDYIGRFDPDGLGEVDRVEAAGYTPEVLVQHIAAGPRDAQELVEQTWLPRAVPCTNLVSSEVTAIGLAYVGGLDDEQSTRWVMVLAGPGESSSG
ncbi:MAG: CAP domain-containing protein [Myxococcota bacterium]